MSGFLVVTAWSVLALAAVQAITFTVGRAIGRYNVVDVAWGAGIVAVAWIALFLGDGDRIRGAVITAIVTVWGVRLSWHMWIKSAGKGEDPRYVDLLDRAGGGGIGTVIRKIFVVQGAAQWFVSLPVQVSAVTGSTTGVALIVAAAGLAAAVVGIGFEAVGDHQLRVFKADPAHRGAIMDRGLWAWTRHPNYFGDACTWWGVWLIAASAWPGVLTVASPALMTYFLVHATGARLLERFMSQRPGWDEYAARTSFFVPLPPRRERR
ncbi:hypothetical protein TPAU25S_01080 [Tsukamurella paurometabola]|uniref:Uncharacterized protein n=1 Tax=Tsukamurella paurometabola (strain ATCC 8368 / DSM 20162 / CCUG 35730 / CIP 100753 / JCM 10117 / KCTC 9821 / NBRC 16120 / NCIMB 702349 / NCTC 13040) TaxID=521096 RepID=D5UXS7_TSUPD|nr:DUF1295 domain-containing protein [Tsukamurella paurometabola]ADG80164.1 protein of unknown function DUF1295 [Tsukamurella paurometabola DSM 20162]SUP38669.1 Predicted membrane protein [Tsukamurella paurometabola]